jgi:outer membrane protein assembly factor BamB
VSRAVLACVVLAVAAPAAAGASGERRGFDYDVPVLSDSPWPEMRRDGRNTAMSPIRARYRGDRPWSARTGRGIFSTPVIGGDETVYVGSADGSFYALGRDGRIAWRFGTGGIIDAAAALGRRNRAGRFPITIGSGDESLYQLRSGPRGLTRRERVRWRFRASAPPATGQLVNWWEGNVAYGPDGNLYVGNTGGGVYSLTPRGEQRWVVQRANSVWTTPAFDEAGNSFWGSVDLYAFSLDPGGVQRWQTANAGYVTSSPALGSDGTVYYGSFDGSLHAADPGTGADRWTFPTADHIYSSPALARDGQGRTSAVYIGSADGSVYAVRPDGSQLWRYDTGEPVRSSPVVGRAPKGDGLIVYVGSSNGKLYALDAESGRRRWSFDTTPSRPPLSDRNDLNGSPALGRRGVYIGGEHGFVWYVPYDYCLHRNHRRCERRPGQEFAADVERVLPVTPGGTTLRERDERVPASTVLGVRLVVRRGGETLDARMVAPQGSDALVSVEPPVDVETQLSGDGHYLFIRPDRILARDTVYRVHLRGDWEAPAASGGFDDTLRFHTEPSRGDLGLRTERDQVGALTISRLALPLPSLLPSVNQIGFDSYDLIAGTLSRSKPNAAGAGRILLWVIAAQRNPHGVPVADPRGNFAFPLAGTYKRDLLSLNASGLNLQFSFGPVPIRSFDLRGRLDRGGSFRSGASLYSEVTCAAVPNYSAYLYVAGVCNAADTLAASGTFLSEGYDPHGRANRRPRGLGIADVALERPTATADGQVVATLRLAEGARYPAGSHLASILLVDPATGAPVSLDYRALTTNLADEAGQIAEVRLRLPAAATLPDSLRAYVIADVFPLGSRGL